MVDQLAEPEPPKQSVRVGVAGYKTRAETGEKSPQDRAETSTPLFGGTLGAHPPEIRPVASEPPEVALVPAEDPAPTPDAEPAPTVATEQET